jgi:hypothetical protein
VPDNAIAGLAAAFEATVSVAVRVPVAEGVNVAPSVQLAPGATVVEPAQVPVAAKSAALVPLIVTAEICSAALPVFVSVVLSPDDGTPTMVVGKFIELLWMDTIGVATATLVPDRETTLGEPGALLVIVNVPARVPAAVGVKVTPIVHEAPALTVPPQVLVAANSGLGDVVTCEMVSAAVPEFFSVTVCVALVVPTVCVAKVKAAGLRSIAGTGAALPVPDNAIAGLLAAFEAMVSVAVRVPVAEGVNVALSVQLAPGATVTVVALTQVPLAEKSAALVPPPVIPEIVRLLEPELVSVTLAGAGIALVDPTCVEPKASAVAVTEITGALAAAGFRMYAAMSAASVLLT